MLAKNAFPIDCSDACNSDYLSIIALVDVTAVK